MNLENLGYTTELEKYRTENGFDSLAVGRVIAEHKERYIVKTANREYNAEILGNMRFTAQDRGDFPAVGDWVAFSEYDNDKGIIHAVFPRKSIIERQAVGKKGDKQIIATNIDKALIVQAVDRDFNVNRMERYLTICNASHVEPIIILNKTDLVDKTTLEQIIERVQSRIQNVSVFPVSNQSQQGIEELKAGIERGLTYCFLGSSGVGKSTLLNTIMGKQYMKTDSISGYSNRGRHVTTHRELFVLENGGIFIDNPGMREVGITDAAEGLEVTFGEIYRLSHDCRFRDCTHTTEAGCAVLEALKNNSIDKSSYVNYLKMVREKDHFESTVAEKRKKDKDFGKMLKNYKKGNFSR